MLSTADAAKEARVSEQTIRRWVKMDALQAEFVGGRWLIDAEDLFDLLEEAGMREKKKPMTEKPKSAGLFDVHILNTRGLERARKLQELFESQLAFVEELCGADSREMSIVRTKLQEAAFFAKRAMAMDPENQE